MMQYSLSSGLVGQSRAGGCLGPFKWRVCLEKPLGQCIARQTYLLADLFTLVFVRLHFNFRLPCAQGGDSIEKKIGLSINLKLRYHFDSETCPHYPLAIIIIIIIIVGNIEPKFK